MNTEISKIKQLTANNFDAVITNNKSLTLVDFWAPWCGPCKLMEPVLEAFSEERDGEVLVAKVNVDDEATLASRYNIRSIPTIVFFRDGQEVDRISGAVSKAALEQKAQKLSVTES